ncbi:alpha-2-macroglobulin family protein [Sphingobacterium pedocola]|uniref:Alpha-2-macroglobulin n=1 Tax=Sphingobacterium pedocola TaxID=2082722 RepID=A0ABR9T1M5_9SPHI|nr:alpha-2-macroglobulin family protein [Sphingobacterium pedocola]MBE8719185.1 alpha-2-macroglobulin [Sphingobacterium pedocola]
MELVSAIMKRIVIALLVLLPFIGIGQDFKSQWEEIDRLISIKNYQQTQHLIATIKAKAQAENNSPEWVRAVLAERYALTINMSNDSAFYHIQQHLLSHIEKATRSEKKVLQNMYAFFLSQHLYQSRVESTNGFLAWEPDKRKVHIDSIFRASLNDKPLLVEEPIDRWKTMVSDLKNRTLAPTLCHLLTYNYLDFLDSFYPQEKNKDEHFIRSLQETNKEKGYSDAYAYLIFRPYTRNGIWEILNHQKQIEKLLGEQHADYNAHILLLLANAQKQQGNKNREAVAYLDKAIDAYPNSPWLDGVKKLYSELTQKTLSLDVPSFAPSEQYIPIKINALNADNAFIKIYRTTNTPQDFKEYITVYDSITQQVNLDAVLVYEEEIALKAFVDYQSHSTNFKINPLPYGNYIILIANNPQFKDNGQDLDVSQADLVVSDVFVSPTIEDKGFHAIDYRYTTLMVNRKNGSPYNNKRLDLYYFEEDVLAKVGSLRTNKNGQFDYLADNDENRYDLDELLLFIPDENHLIPLDHLQGIPEHIREKNNEEKLQNDALLFTDRAIYRPGQEVFFKAIVYTKDILKGMVVPSQLIKVILKDANRQSIDTLDLTTNAFGSVNSSFRIPQKTLNGSFRLEIYTGNNRLAEKIFSVEEYKRPTFKVSFDENKQTYTKQDTAIFTGTAESLSGASLSNISVKYNVSFYDTRTYRQINYLDTVTTTDATGKFTFRIPLMDTVFRDQSDFTLQFQAEALNETGEIQTSSGSYSYSDKPLRVAIVTSGQVVEGEWNNLVVKTSNPNGHPLAAKGIINIYKYENPNIIQGERKIFDFHAEYHILDTISYQKYFPWYFDKLDLITERPKTLVGTLTFDSNDTDTVQIGNMHAYGAYFIEAYTTMGTDTTKASQNIQVRSKEDHKISNKDFLNVRTDRSTYTLGDQAIIGFQTDFKQATGVYLWKVRGNTKSPVEFIHFKRGYAAYTHKITEADIQGKIWFEVMMVQENKIVTRRLDIPIVRTDKFLDIQVRTFRDKITPGQKEKWSFTVKNKDKATHGEVLASMYDTALDQFARNNFPSSFATGQYRRWYRIYSGWSSHAFHNQKSSSTLFSRPIDGYNIFENPPVLLSFGIARQGVFHSFDTLQEMVVTGAVEEVAYKGSGNTIQQVSGSAIGSTNGVEDITIRGRADLGNQPPLYVIDGKVMENLDQGQLAPDNIYEIVILKDAEATALYGSKAANGVILVTTKEAHKLAQLNQVQARSNLQETAFFYPNLLTDNEGNVTFEFDSPEALTRWKLMLFAHTEDLKAGTASFFTQTQKQLMVRPNLPRFMREGDEVVIKTQVQNLSDTVQSGTARLEIINPENNEVISHAFFADNGLRGFSVATKGNSTVSWTLHIPKGYPTVQIKVVGATDEFSDGEIHELAILPNRILLTDTEKIVLDAGQSKTFTIHSKGKDNLQAKIQVQSNPILEIISALDYLKNYPYECNEQTASKWYGLKMLQYIQKHYPAISTYFNNINPDEVDSKLEESSKLSELLMEEMPWVRQIQNDKQRVKSLARLFKANFSSEISALEKKLEKAQLANGAFSWFEGGKADTHMSLRLLEIFGKVGKLDQSLIQNEITNISDKLIHFLDQDTAIYRSKASTGLVLDYLYVRALWNDRNVLPAVKTEQLRKHIDLTASYTADQPAGLAAKAWLVNALYDYRIASIEVKNRITQEVIYDQERGMYWESNASRYNGMSLQSYMVEAYKQLDSTKLDLITQWIYYSKQHNHWQTTWNTVDAVYALLLANNPKDFVLDNTVAIHIDRQVVATDDKVLGQIGKELPSQELATDKVVQVTNNNNRKIYGGIYHQYFVPLEDIRSEQKELSVSKKLLVQKNAEWVETTAFKTGDKIKIQLTIINNEPLNYVHLRDGRAAGFEPVYQSSGYQFWKGYYFTIKDASTNYFFDYLPKGRHVYEYEVKTNNNGVFSSGIAQIECMYDPTVNARSENTKVRIED